MSSDWNEKLKLFHYSAYFLLLFMGPLDFLALFMSLIILFQLTFTFIYNTFSNNFSVSAKEKKKKDKFFPNGH